MKVSFAFDCDDVLCHFTQKFMDAYEIIKETRPNEVKPLGDFSTEPHNFINMPAEIFQSFIPVLQEIKAIENSLPLVGAKDALQFIKKDLDAEIHVITARGWHPQGKQLTEDWLNRWGFPVDSLHVVNVTESKKKVLEGLPNCIGYVDDRPEHVQAAREVGIPNTFLFNQPWNDDSIYPEYRWMKVYSHNDLVNEVIENMLCF